MDEVYGGWIISQYSGLKNNAQTSVLEDFLVTNYLGQTSQGMATYQVAAGTLTRLLNVKNTVYPYARILPSL